MVYSPASDCAAPPFAQLSHSVALTIWRLKDPSGVETHCVLENAGTDSCELRVEQEGRVIYSEEHPSVEAAFLRTSAMWIECQRDGWTEFQVRAKDQHEP